jgi:hypothetical protein
MCEDAITKVTDWQFQLQDKPTLPITLKPSARFGKTITVPVWKANFGEETSVFLFSWRATTKHHLEKGIITTEPLWDLKTRDKQSSESLGILT